MGSLDTQAILAALDHLKTQVTRIENTQRWAENFRSLSANSRAHLLPLLDLGTRLEISNCPTTIGHILRLSSAESTRILSALQVDVPVGLAAQRAAVR